MSVMNGHQDIGSGSITFLSGPLADTTFQITKLDITIGRAISNDIVVSDEQVSRYHAHIYWENGTWRIESLAPQNALTVDHQLVQQAVIQDKSVITLGLDSTFVFHPSLAVLACPDEADTLCPALPPKETKPDAVMVQQPQSDAPTHPIQRIPATTPVEPASAAEIIPVTPIAPSPLAAQRSGSEWTDETIALPELYAQTMMTHFLPAVPTLVISSNTTGGRQHYLLDKPIINIGRDEKNDIVIRDQTVSKQHLQIVQEGKNFILVHPHPTQQRTTNGLLYQGRKIRGDEAYLRVLTPGDVFRIGDEHGTLISLTYHDGSNLQQEVLPPIHPIKLDMSELTLGRHINNTVVLSHPQVSAHHAKLVREGGTYRIMDLHSTNHVYVNAQLVTNQLLKLGDELRIGPYRLVYETTQLVQYDESQSIQLDALNLKVSTRKQVTLLNDISLSIPPRTFVALVGASGAGKTTLLNALSGIRPANSGSVFYNGEDYYHNLAAFNTQIGYVPQEDIVHRDLSVERALFYAAKFRLPSDLTSEQIQQRITEVLEDVELTDQRGLMVKQLSGGQRKRVSLALELLANPSLFFLDEPTSGLDPGLDRKMMLLLRRLTDRGRTVILVTHATNNISICDYICFLAPGGYVVYYGPPDEAKNYFGRADFAEIYSLIEATKEHPQAPQDAEARFKNSPEYQRYIAEPLSKQPIHPSSQKAAQGKVKRTKRGNSWTQFLLLSLRCGELLKNDIGNLLILLLQAPIIGMLIVLLMRFQIGANIFNVNTMLRCSAQVNTPSGLVSLPNVQPTSTVDCSQVLNFLQNNPLGVAYAHHQGSAIAALQNFILPGSGINAQKMLFITIFAAALFGCVNGTREIVKELAIYRREQAVNLGLLPYMFSKIAVLGLLCLLQSAILVGLIEIAEPLQQGVFLPVILETYTTLALTALLGLMIGLTISAVAPNTDRAVSFVPIVLIPLVLFAGALVPLKDWWTQIIAVVIPTRWALVALSTSLGLHDDKIAGNQLFGSDYASHGLLYSIYTKSEAMQRLLLSWGMLVLLIVVFLCVTAFFLKRKDIRV